MGATGVASGYGPQAIFWNPAVAAKLEKLAFSAGYCAWFLGAHQSSVFVVRRLSTLRVGVGLSSFSAGKLEWRDDIPSETPIGTFEPQDLTAYVNAAMPLDRLLSVGLSGRFYYSHIQAHSASGLGIDLGLRSEPLTDLALGAAVLDLGTPLTYEREKVWLPTRGKLGVAWTPKLFGQRVTLAVDGSYSFNSGLPSVHAGGEFELAELLCVRGGCGISSQGIRPALGLGLHHSQVAIDYSLEQVGYDLGVAHRLALRLGN